MSTNLQKASFSHDFSLNPHFAVQSGNGFNPDVELLRVCETFSFLEKDEQTLSSSKSQRSGIFPLKNPG